MRLQHVSIPRPEGEENRQRGIDFYGRILGMAQKPVPQSLVGRGLVWFVAGESDLELHVFPVEPWEADKTERHFCLAVDDQTAVRQQLEANGVETRDTTPIVGRPRFFCQDPFGNTVEITTVEDDYQ